MDFALFDDECVDAKAMEMLLDDRKYLIAHGLAILGGVEILDVGGVEQVESQFGKLRFEREGAWDDDAGERKETGAAGAEIKVAAFVDEDVEGRGSGWLRARGRHGRILHRFRRIARIASREGH